jgi:methionyl-tRNA formyltransferase
MKLVFLGTPDIAAFILQQMIEHSYRPELVITKEDAPAGRGMKLQASAVKQVAIHHNIAVATASSLKKNPNVIEQIKNIDPDYIIVVAYGCILLPEVLSIAKYGCINVHASLLPKWRGAAPIQRSILAGDDITGVTIMQMDSGLDTGNILLQQVVEINTRETHGSLYEKIKIAGSQALIKYLENCNIVHGNNDYGNAILSIPQEHAYASYAAKIQKSEAIIDFNKTAPEVDLHVRGFNPPGAYSYLEGVLYKIWETAVVECDDNSNSIPGTIVKADRNGLIVKCGICNKISSFLKVIVLQAAGKPKQNYNALVNSSNMIGKIFGEQI